MKILATGNVVRNPTARQLDVECRARNPRLGLCRVCLRCCSTRCQPDGKQQVAFETQTLARCDITWGGVLSFIITRLQRGVNIIWDCVVRLIITRKYIDLKKTESIGHGILVELGWYSSIENLNTVLSLNLSNRTVAAFSGATWKAVSGVSCWNQQCHLWLVFQNNRSRSTGRFLPFYSRGHLEFLTGGQQKHTRTTRPKCEAKFLTLLRVNVCPAGCSEENCICSWDKCDSANRISWELKIKISSIRSQNLTSTKIDLSENFTWTW